MIYSIDKNPFYVEEALMESTVQPLRCHESFQSYMKWQYYCRIHCARGICMHSPMKALGCTAAINSYTKRPKSWFPCLTQTIDAPRAQRQHSLFNGWRMSQNLFVGQRCLSGGYVYVCQRVMDYAGRQTQRMTFLGIRNPRIPSEHEAKRAQATTGISHSWSWVPTLFNHYFYPGKHRVTGDWSPQNPVMQTSVTSGH